MKTPKEHGAWAMLYVSFALGALVAWRLSLATLWALVATTALFFARETLWRLRRARRQRRPAGDLLRSLGIELGAVALCGALLLWRERLLGFLPLGAAGVLLLVFNLARTEQREARSVVAELVAFAGFAMAAPAAHYATRGAWESLALWLWALCWLYFISSVFHVKATVLAVQPQRRAAFVRMRTVSAVYHGVLALLLGGLVAMQRLPPLVLVAYAPLLVRSFGSMLRRPARLDLRRLGWLEIAYSLVFLFCVTLAFHAA